LSDQAPAGLYQPAPGPPPQGGDPQGPGGPGSTPPPQRRHRVRNTVLGVLGVLVIVIVIMVAASGGGGGSAAPSASGTPRVHGSLPAHPATGVGTSFPAKTGSGGTYRVRLDLILDPAQPAGRPATRQHGVRLIGVVLTVKAVRGALQGVNAHREVAVVGSNGRTYRPVATPIAGYAGFRHGRIGVAQGGSATGAVTFRLPAGVTVSRVSWAAGAGATLRWPVP
jgi:hypothetical protein